MALPEKGTGAKGQRLNSRSHSWAVARHSRLAAADQHVKRKSGDHLNRIVGCGGWKRPQKLPSMRSPLSPQLEPRSLAQTPTYARASQEDLREYLVYLDHTNLSEAQKFELLQTLWSIMSTFVDLAFGADPVQKVLPSIRSDVDSEDSIPAAGNQSTEGQL